MKKDGVKSRILKHIAQDTKEFKHQLAEDKKLKKFIKKGKK